MGKQTAATLIRYSGIHILNVKNCLLFRIGLRSNVCPVNII